MSISIYYSARRSTPLTDEERARIAKLKQEYAIEE